MFVCAICGEETCEGHEGEETCEGHEVVLHENEGIEIQIRVNKLASLLCMTPTPRTRLCYEKDRWWLLGCLEGDQPFPKSIGIKNSLDSIERWIGSLSSRKGRE